MEPFKKTLKDWGVEVDKPMTFEHFYDQILPEKAKSAFHALALNEYTEPFRPTLWAKPNAHQKLVQCWFPGDHIDCGSGDHDWEIPDITLAWMMTQSDKNRVLRFKPGYIEDAFKESKDIAAKESYKIQNWGHGGYHTVHLRDAKLRRSIKYGSKRKIDSLGGKPNIGWVSRVSCY